MDTQWLAVVSVVLLLVLWGWGRSSAFLLYGLAFAVVLVVLVVGAERAGLWPESLGR